MDRITRMASLCKGSICVCDVGCDHAYTLVEAIKKYGVKKGIAADIAEGPLANANKTITDENLLDNVDIILSNGFDNIEASFDTVIISGMGGALITEILSRGLSKIRGKKLILEANCEVYRIRQFISRNGFLIEHEEAFYDQGKYYEILVCVPGIKKMDELDILYGPILRKNPNDAYKLFYDNKINLLSSIIPQINNPTKKDIKIKELNELVTLFKYPAMEKYHILDTNNYYRTYFIDNKKRPTIFVAPGGGYKYTSPRESEPVVDEFHKKGYHVVVVNYRETFEEAYPMPGKYLAYALNEIRKDKRVSKIIGLGFSAGGHCILEMCLHSGQYNIENIDLLMLAYPVITANRQYAHLGSFEMLLKEEVNNETLRNYLSLETQVRCDNTPNIFLWGTYTDEAVPVMNSFLLLDACNKANINAEYHMFPMGGHGLSVANSNSSEGNKQKENPYIAKWVDLANEWIQYKIKNQA